MVKASISRRIKYQRININKENNMFKFKLLTETVSKALSVALHFTYNTAKEYIYDIKLTIKSAHNVDYLNKAYGKAGFNNTSSREYVVRKGILYAIDIQLLDENTRKEKDRLLKQLLKRHYLVKNNPRYKEVKDEFNKLSAESRLLYLDQERLESELRKIYKNRRYYHYNNPGVKHAKERITNSIRKAGHMFAFRATKLITRKPLIENIEPVTVVSAKASTSTTTPEPVISNDMNREKELEENKAKGKEIVEEIDTTEQLQEAVLPVVPFVSQDVPQQKEQSTKEWALKRFYNAKNAIPFFQSKEVSHVNKLKQDILDQATMIKVIFDLNTSSEYKMSVTSVTSVHTQEEYYNEFKNLVDSGKINTVNDARTYLINKLCKDTLDGKIIVNEDSISFYPYTKKRFKETFIDKQQNDQLRAQYQTYYDQMNDDDVIGMRKDYFGEDGKWENEATEIKKLKSSSMNFVIGAILGDLDTKYYTDDIGRTPYTWSKKNKYGKRDITGIKSEKLPLILDNIYCFVNTLVILTPYLIEYITENIAQNYIENEINVLQKKNIIL